MSFESIYKRQDLMFSQIRLLLKMANLLFLYELQLNEFKKAKNGYDLDHLNHKTILTILKEYICAIKQRKAEGRRIYFLRIQDIVHQGSRKIISSKKMIKLKIGPLTRKLHYLSRNLISIGERIPDLKVNTIEFQMGKYLLNFASTSSLFSPGKYVLFGFSGAFNPSCQDFYIPQYIKQAKLHKKEGLNFYAMSVNDPYVLQAFAESLRAGDLIDFIADGDGSFSRALDVLVDLSEFDMGMRCRYFSMSIEDGRVTELNDPREDFMMTVNNISPEFGINRTVKNNLHHQSL